MTEELKGAEIDFDLKGGKVIVKVEHVGKHGYAKLEAGADAKPFLEKAIDKVEELIPGDQKAIAQALKLALSKVEL